MHSRYIKYYTDVTLYDEYIFIFMDTVAVQILARASKH